MPIPTGKKKKNEDQSKVETHSQLFRREILPWKLSFPAKRGHFLDNNKKKKMKKREKLPSLSTVVQLPTPRNEKRRIPG